jgi:FKBP-type peptidyl-prolyl cis-trans isomerase
MSRSNLTTGIAVVAAIVVVAIFFIFGNPFDTSVSATATTSTAPAPTTGLVVQDETMGTGETAQPGMVVTVDYTGKLQDGSVFDSSIGRAPISFMLGSGQVIPGWDQGIQGMKVGGKRLLIIPPQLGYGAQQYGPIPANSTLVFEVQLISVQPASSGVPTAPEGASAN